MEFVEQAEQWLRDLPLDNRSVFGIAFATIFLVSLGLILLVRAIWPGEDNEVRASRRLRRAKTVFDESPATDGLGQFNQWFARLILESGLSDSPIAGFLFFVCWGILAAGGVWISFQEVLATVAAFVGAILLAMLALVIVRGLRMRQIREQLPHVADIMARGVKAGESLDQAIALVGQEAKGALGREFTRCSRQLDMGRSLQTVMQSFALRVRMIETQILASTLIVHRQTGGNLVLSLERMAAVIRDRMNFQRQLRASTGAGRVSIVIIATVTPLLFFFLFLWRPDHFDVLLDDPLGRTLLATALVLEVIGLLWVWRLLRSD